MNDKESGLLGLFDEDLAPEAKDARLSEGIELNDADTLTEPCDKTDVCY